MDGSLSYNTTQNMQRWTTEPVSPQIKIAVYLAEGFDVLELATLQELLGARQPALAQRGGGCYT